VSELEINPVRDSGSLRQFMEFPYRHYGRDSHWVPPLRVAQKDLLDRSRHPFYQHAEAEFFVATEDGRVTGRIAAILDRSQAGAGGPGSFGFFECVRSQRVASALVDAVRRWHQDRDVGVFRGPFNPSSNYDCGTLVHGFDRSPFVMMPYNPDWYNELLQGAGLIKAKDLLAYSCHPKNAQNVKAGRVAERAAEAHGLTIRPINLKEFGRDVDAIWQIYNSAWSQNWGYAPMSRDEFRLAAKEMRQILIPDFVLVGEIRGQPVGFALALPDINQALKPAGGNLFPLGLIKILYHKRRIRNLRVLALGVTEEYRATGVAACFYSRLIREAVRLGWEECEFSWVLEDNTLMNRSIEAIGGRHYKTYRIYEGTIQHA